MRLPVILSLILPFTLGFGPPTPQRIVTRPVPAASPDDDLWSDQFGLPAIDGFVDCVVMFRGDLIVGGRFSQAGGVPASNIARWDGNAWTALGAGLDNDVLALHVFQDRLIVGGRFATAGSVSAIGVAQWDGTNWQPMGEGLTIPLWWPPAETTAFVDYGNALVAAGGFQQSGNTSVHGVALWDGLHWNPLGEGLDGQGRTVAVWKDTLYVGGYFSSAGGVNAGSLAKWDGSAWYDVGAGLTSSGSTAWVYSLAVYNNELIVGGGYDQAGDIHMNNIASWDGFSWKAMGSGSEWEVTTMAVFQDKLIGPQSYGQGLLAWDGSSWSPTVPVPIGTVACLLPLNDGLVVGGSLRASLTQDGPIRGFQIAKWTGSDWIGYEPWTSRMHGLSMLFGGFPHIQSLASYQGDLIAGGALDLAGDPPQWSDVGPIAAWNGTDWQSLGHLNAFGQTYTLLSEADTLYAGGTLWGPTGDRALWRFDGAAWTAIDTLNATIVSLVRYNGTLYVGSRRSGTPDAFSGGLFRWDGRHLISVAAMDPGVSAMAVHSGKLVVAGDFTSIGGVDAPGLATWDGSRWETLPGDPRSPGDIEKIVSWQGRLIVGGSLCQLPGCPSVAVLESGSWEPLSGLQGHLFCLAVLGSRLFAGGWLYHVPSFSPLTLATWDTADWIGLGSGTNGGVFALQEHLGTLYAGGDFTQAGGKSSFGVAQWNGLSPGSVPGQAPRAAMSAARPSPFRTSTTLPFSVAKSGRVRITVHDTSGRIVATLEDAVLDPGDHTTHWNGRDGSGHRVASGVYFVRAEMPGGTHHTRKVALLR